MVSVILGSRGGMGRGGVPCPWRGGGSGGHGPSCPQGGLLVAQAARDPLCPPSVLGGSRLTPRVEPTPPGAGAAPPQRGSCFGPVSPCPPLGLRPLALSPGSQFSILYDVTDVRPCTNKTVSGNTQRHTQRGGAGGPPVPLCPFCVPFPIPRASWLPYVPQFPHHPAGRGAGPARPGGCDPPSPPPLGRLQPPHLPQLCMGGPWPMPPRAGPEQQVGHIGAFIW